MSEHSPKVEIKFSLAGSPTELLSVLNSVFAYARTMRNNATLLRDLAGDAEGMVEINRESLHLAMSSQVALSEALLESFARLMAMANEKAASDAAAAAPAKH